MRGEGAGEGETRRGIAIGRRESASASEEWEAVTLAVTLTLVASVCRPAAD
jgi:hypothetical protein